MPGLRTAGSVMALCVAAALLVSPQAAHGFMPVSQNATLEIPLPEFDLEGFRSPDRLAAASAVANDMAARYGVAWHVHSWNPQTRTPHFTYGRSIALVPAVGSEQEMATLARQVVADNASVLRADVENLRLESTPHALGKWAAHFQQTYHGLDVWGAKVRIVVTDDGRLMLMGSDYYNNITVDWNPGLSAEQATSIARSDVPFQPSTDRIDGQAVLMILPYPLAPNEVEHHLVWRVRVRTEDPLGIWVTYVDAHSGRILWRWNDIHFAYSGTSTADTQVYGYCDGIGSVAGKYLDIDVAGIGTVTSDVDGNWSIAGTGGPRVVSCDLFGPYVDMNNVAGAEAFFSGNAQENVPFNVHFSDANAQNDERDTFNAVNQVHDFIEQFDPGFSYSNTRITANVSRPQTCNAYWDGTINFYVEGGGCGNTGEMQQVAHHEFGHGVQNAIIGSQGGQGLGEGNGDILGNLITQDPIIGRGFYLNNCVSGIRNSENTLSYPGDVVGQEIHFAGQVIAGFNWDAMQGLQAMYGLQAGTVMSGARWHFGRVLLQPTNQPDQVFATFVADDDNGNLDDGTPNHPILCEAAANHGFDCPEILVGVFFSHSAHPYTGVLAGTYDVVGQAVSLPEGDGAIIPGSVTVHYRVDGGGFTDVAMTATGNPNEYVGPIPAQAYGSVVEYYLSASDDLGANGTSPVDAPVTLHYFKVNDEFTEEMETPTAWVSGALDDNAASGDWVRVDPIGTSAQPEDDHTLLGTQAWITGQHQAGETAGFNDVDDGKTTLYSPRFDLNDATDITVSYWKWYSNDQGNNPGADFWDVQVSGDDGQTWQSVEHTNVSTNAWVQVNLNLVDYIADPGIVRFRFVASDVAPGSLIEGAVDDFVLAAIFDVTGADEDGLGIRFLTGLEQNRPNPFSPTTEISFSLAQAGDAHLRVVDASGRLVRTLASGSRTAGQHRVVWDGTDEQGHPVAAGTYFYNLVANGKALNAKMVLMK